MGQGGPRTREDARCQARPTETPDRRGEARYSGRIARQGGRTTAWRPSIHPSAPTGPKTRRTDPLILAETLATLTVRRVARNHLFLGEAGQLVGTRRFSSSVQF